MTKNKVKCKHCFYWNKIEDWNERMLKKDLRNMGFCYFDQPKLLQNIVPSVVRERGLGSLFENTEHFQFTPITEENRYCHNFEKRKKKNE